MLDKLENRYLSLLRAVILVIATVSLIVASVAVVLAIPKYVESKGLTESSEIPGGTLAEFVAQQKPVSDESAVNSESEDLSLALPDIKDAAKLVKTYLGKRSNVAEKDLVSSLQIRADELGQEAGAYAVSVRELANDLVRSQGKPLSERRVFSLLVWHQSNFKAHIENRQMNKSIAISQFWASATLAGSAFIAFILTVFVFLFVKIERNLRVIDFTPLEQQPTEAWHE